MPDPQHDPQLFPDIYISFADHLIESEFENAVKRSRGSKTISKLHEKFYVYIPQSVSRESKRIGRTSQISCRYLSQVWTINIYKKNICYIPHYVYLTSNYFKLQSFRMSQGFHQKCRISCRIKPVTFLYRLFGIDNTKKIITMKATTTAVTW